MARKDITRDDKQADLRANEEAHGQTEERQSAGDRLLDISDEAAVQIAELAEVQAEFMAEARDLIKMKPRNIGDDTVEHAQWRLNLRERISKVTRQHHEAVRRLHDLTITAAKVYLQHDLERQFKEMEFTVEDWRTAMADHAQLLTEQIQPYLDLADAADRPGSPEFLEALQRIREVRPSPDPHSVH